MLLVDLNHPSPADTNDQKEPHDAEKVENFNESSDNEIQIERAISLAASIICDAYLNG